MSKFIFFGKVFLLTIFFCLVYSVVQYAGVIRGVITSQFFHSTKAVAGARTSFEDKVKEDIGEYTEQAKQKVLQIKVSDVIQGLGRTVKIVRDANTAKEYIVDTINTLLKK